MVKKKYHIHMILENELMSRHTTFRIGGKARWFVVPETVEELFEAIKKAEREGHRHFILGGGANVLFPDDGYDGVVISTEALSEIYFDEKGLLHAGCGAKISDVAKFAVENGKAGIQFFYSMPGSTGGAIYMNARCYNVSIADVLLSTKYLDKSGNICNLETNGADFDYKVSPFQTNGGIILEGIFAVSNGDSSELKAEMLGYESDRTSKGHFIYPCAGSVFKNNHSFGQPSGKIIDSLGLRGYTIGGAKISEHHANIIVNTGGASAQDVKDLVSFVERKVEERYGFKLEREIIYV